MQKMNKQWEKQKSMHVLCLIPDKLDDAEPELVIPQADSPFAKHFEKVVHGNGQDRCLNCDVLEFHLLTGSLPTKGFDMAAQEDIHFNVQDDWNLETDTSFILLCR